MKKAVCFGLVLTLCMGLLSGCKNKMDVEKSTVYVDKKGHVVSVDVEALDKEYYDETELEDYITEHVTDYTMTYADTVKKEAFETKDGIAKLQMSYDSYEDYSKFNGIEFYTGTVVTAQAEGYDFETEFVRMPEKSDKDAAAETVSRQDVIADDSCKVVIIKANVDVEVDGTILYVSSQDTEITGKDTVSINGEGSSEEAALTYIIYK